MKSSKLVSIIIPVYNKEQYIQECIDSVTSQTYTNIEIVIIDDGSKDNSLKICQENAKKDNRIKVFSKQNGGISSARNYGISKATGIYIYFLDSDDWIEKDTIKDMVECSINNKAEIVQACPVLEYDNKSIKTNIIERQDKNIKKCQEKILTTNNVTNKEYGTIRWVCNKLFLKENIENIEFNTNIYLLEDGLFIFELLEKIDSIYFLNKNTYHYRIISTSSSNSFHKDLLEQLLNLINTFKKLINNDSLLNSYYNLELQCFMSYISKYIKNNKNSITKYKNEIKRITKIDSFDEMIHNSKYQGNSIKQNLVLFCLKNKIYTLLVIICLIKK